VTMGKTQERRKSDARATQERRKSQERQERQERQEPTAKTQEQGPRSRARGRTIAGLPWVDDESGGRPLQHAASASPAAAGSDVARARHPHLRLVRSTSFYERHVKTAFDRAVAAALLVVLGPLLFAIALAVRVNLGPGVLYRQERIGQNGTTFSMLKFRTMQPDRRRTADGQLRTDRRAGTGRRSGHDRRRVQVALDGPDRRVGSERRLEERRVSEGSRRRTHKTPDDPRHTGLGRFLRASNFDELPQLVNVVRGELSLVGPRPELPEVVADYEPWQHARHGVKPGLTGLWQTTDRGSGEPMHLHVDRDLEYIERISVRTDLAILLVTVPVLLGLDRTNRGS